MLCAGLIEAAANTFMLLIAVRSLSAGPAGKALVAAGNSVGFLLSPIVVNAVARRGWPPALAASRTLLCGAGCCVVAAFAPNAWVYVPAAMLGMAMNSAVIPLMTQIYQDNYPQERRGKLYAAAYMLRIFAAMACGAVAGRFLDLHPASYPFLILLFAAAFVVASIAVGGLTSSRLKHEAESHPFTAFRFLRSDRLFRNTLVMWMLMGFANLMMLPLRIEFLGNPKHGIPRTAAQIAMLTTVVPNIARLAMNPVWGWLFDRANFFILRAAINLGFAVGIAAFFTSDTNTGLMAGAVIYGISNAGGDVAWGLWVTKFSPPGRVADYMSVHTFLTGVRGVIAPMAAFQLIQRYPASTLGWCCAGLIVIASSMLIPELTNPAGKSRGQLLNEEGGDA
jgi:Major Facilitator Superfamily